MIDAIWIVWETRGEYSDRTENAVCWFATEAEAEERVAFLTVTQNYLMWDSASWCVVRVERGQPIEASK